MKLSRGLEPRSALAFQGWCCPYCGAGLRGQPHGLLCEPEERWFATDRGIHRLLTAERREEIRPFVEFAQRLRRDEGRSRFPADTPRWATTKALLLEGLESVEDILGRRPLQVLEVGGGCSWASALALERGHEVVAVDVDLDLEAGLPAADRLLPPGAVLPRAEAELESLPLEPSLFDLVIVVGALHVSPHPSRGLLELRRVARRGGWLLGLDSPVFRSRHEGEAAVALRMGEHGRRYGLSIPRESEEGYLVFGELRGLFQSTGWDVEIRRWPSRLREFWQDAASLLTEGRRPERRPLLLARRDG